MPAQRASRNRWPARADGDTAELWAEVERMQPDGHGLTMLPFLSGERAPGYHGEAHVTVTGINPATRAAHLVRALTRAVPTVPCTSCRTL